MAFTIPNNDEAFNVNQSIIMRTDIEAIVAGILGNGVVSGCAVTAQGSPDMTVAVASGVVRVAGVQATVTSGNVTITTADATNPRIDLVVVGNTGTKSCTAGTAAANPKEPDIPASSVLLAMVYVPANDTTMASNQITDKRVLLNNIAGLAGTFNANTFLGGPASGAAAAPTQRALASADLPQANAVASMYEDFLNGTNGAFSNGATGTGAGQAYTITDPGGHPGIVQCQTGTTTTGTSGLGVGGTTGIADIRLAFGAWVYEGDIRIPTASDGTDTFAVIAGFNDSRTGTGTDMVAFRYSSGTNSGKFEAVSRQNSTETATDTTITMTANQWYKLRVEINAAATSVAFYIDGVLVATNTTNIPTGSGRETGIWTGITKSAGTTSRNLDIDYLLYTCTLTTPR